MIKIFILYHMQHTYIFFPFLILTVMATPQAVGWTNTPLIVAGQCSLVNTSTSNKVVNYTQPFNYSLVHTPNVVMGMIALSMVTAGLPTGFSILITNITTSSCGIQLTVLSNCTVVALYYQYFAVDNTLTTLLPIQYNFASSGTLKTGSGNRQENNTISTSLNFNTSDSVSVLCFINGFYINPNGGTYNLSATAVLSTTNSITLTVSTGGVTIVNSATIHLLVYDTTTIQQNYVNFVDYGTIQGKNSAQTSPVSTLTSQYQYRGFIFGLNNMDVNNNTISFGFVANPNPSLQSTLATGSSYNYLFFVALNYRVRSCPNLYPLYAFVNQTCDTTCVTNYYNPTAYNYCSYCDPTQFRGVDVYQNSCLCTTGYFDNNTSICAVCSYTCLNCTTSATYCTVCNSSFNRALNANQCPCNTGYFDNGTSNCSTCTYTCLTCLNTSTHCISCNGSLFRSLNSSACICSSGYYDDGTNALCQTCSYECQTCQTSSHNCTLCYSGSFRTLNNSACVCNSGYYDNNTNSSTCATCDNRCLTCNSNGCLTCNSTINRILSGTSCLCNTGYFENSSLTCQQCVFPCLNCSGTSSNCTGCDSSLFRSLTSNNCTCSSGYVQISQVCYTTTCVYSCSSCSNTNSSYCQSCNASNYRQLSTNQCSCMSGYYDDGSNQLCLACSYECQTCQSSSHNCTLCYSGSFRTLTSNACVCNTGYYDNNTNSSTCATCDSRCLTCNSNGCVTCDSTINRLLSSTSCLCSSGYFQNSTSVCQLCSYPCLTCSSTATNCTSCDSTLHLTLKSNNCECATGYSLLNQSCVNSSQYILTLQSTNTVPYQNSVILTFSVSPSNTQLSNINLTQAISITSSAVSSSSYSYSNGILTIQLNYNQTIQNTNLSLTFAPTNANSSLFTSFSTSSQNIVITSSNNMYATFYPSSIYSTAKTIQVLCKFLLYLSLFLFLVGIFINKLISVEFMTVVQLSYIGMILVTKVPPLLLPFTEIKQVNGYNILIETAIGTLPTNMFNMEYRTGFISNFNFMVLILLIPYLIALVLFAYSFKNATVRLKFKKYKKKLLYEFPWTFLLFNAGQISVSTMVLMIYPSTNLPIYVTIIQYILLVSLILLTIFLSYKYFQNQQLFKDFDSSFSNEKISIYRYYWLLISRILMAILIVSFSSSKSSVCAYLLFTIPIVSICSILMKSYEKKQDTIRALGNQAVVIFCLAYYVSLALNPQIEIATNSFIMILPLALVITLIVCVICNFAIICKFKYQQLYGELDTTSSKYQSQRINEQLQTKRILQQQRNLHNLLIKRSPANRNAARPVLYNKTPRMLRLQTDVQFDAL